MKIDFIAIGSELLNGHTIEVNANWLSSFLGQHGHKVNRIQICPDHPQEIIDCLESSLRHADHIVFSGGLGPTEDDITKHVLADYFKQDLIEDSALLEHIKQLYQSFGKTYRLESSHYHLRPKAFQWFPNPEGLAPGLHYQHNKTQIFLAPGVPREFSAFLEKVYWPKMYKKRAHHRLVIRTKRIPEEKIFFELCPTLWNDLKSWGKVSSLPQLMGVDIVIESDDNQIPNQEVMDFVMATPLAPYIWQWGEKSPEEFLISSLQSKKLTLATAESCTGGLIADSLTNIPGSSSVFLGGVIPYSNQLKQNILNVSEQTLIKHGAVSEAVVKEMVAGTLELTKADYAVATSGIAGPGGGSPEKPVGTLALAVGNKNQIKTQCLHFKGHRLLLKKRFATLALLSVLDAVEEASSD